MTAAYIARVRIPPTRTISSPGSFMDRNINLHPHPQNISQQIENINSCYPAPLHIPHEQLYRNGITRLA